MCSWATAHQQRLTRGSRQYGANCYATCSRRQRPSARARARRRSGTRSGMQSGGRFGDLSAHEPLPNSCGLKPAQTRCAETRAAFYKCCLPGQYRAGTVCTPSRDCCITLWAQHPKNASPTAARAARCENTCKSSLRTRYLECPPVFSTVNTRAQYTSISEPANLLTQEYIWSRHSRHEAGS